MTEVSYVEPWLVDRAPEPGCCSSSLPACASSPQPPQGWGPFLQAYPKTQKNLFEQALAEIREIHMSTKVDTMYAPFCSPCMIQLQFLSS